MDRGLGKEIVDTAQRLLERIEELQLGQPQAEKNSRILSMINEMNTDKSAAILRDVETWGAERRKTYESFEKPLLKQIEDNNRTDEVLSSSVVDERVREFDARLVTAKDRISDYAMAVIRSAGNNSDKEVVIPTLKLETPASDEFVGFGKAECDDDLDEMQRMKMREAHLVEIVKALSEEVDGISQQIVEERMRSMETEEAVRKENDGLKKELEEARAEIERLKGEAEQRVAKFEVGELVVFEIGGTCGSESERVELRCVDHFDVFHYENDGEFEGESRSVNPRNRKFMERSGAEELNGTAQARGNSETSCGGGTLEIREPNARGAPEIRETNESDALEVLETKESGDLEVREGGTLRRVGNDNRAMKGDNSQDDVHSTMGGDSGICGGTNGSRRRVNTPQDDDEQTLSFTRSDTSEKAQSGKNKEMINGQDPSQEAFQSVDGDTEVGLQRKLAEAFDSLQGQKKGAAPLIALDENGKPIDLETHVGLIYNKDGKAIGYKGPVYDKDGRLIEDPASHDGPVYDKNGNVVPNPADFADGFVTNDPAAAEYQEVLAIAGKQKRPKEMNSVVPLGVRRRGDNELRFFYKGKKGMGLIVDAKVHDQSHGVSIIAPTNVKAVKKTYEPFGYGVCQIEMETGLMGNTLQMQRIARLKLHLDRMSGDNSKVLNMSCIGSGLSNDVEGIKWMAMPTRPLPPRLRKHEPNTSRSHPYGNTVPLKLAGVHLPAIKKPKRK